MLNRNLKIGLAVGAVAITGLLIAQHFYYFPIMHYWPLLMLALCPMMHLFHGHGGHNHYQSNDCEKGNHNSAHHHSGDREYDKEQLQPKKRTKSESKIVTR